MWRRSRTRLKKLPLPELAENEEARRPDRDGHRLRHAVGARFAEAEGIDMILVGDRAMVVLGHQGTTVPVTMDEMLTLTRAVDARRADRSSSATCRSLYQVADEEAVRNAVASSRRAARTPSSWRAGPMLVGVRAIVRAGIPVRVTSG